jgi:murein DD-endopeptidase MepM/ murein hydrolase activator NlpD
LSYFNILNALRQSNNYDDVKQILIEANRSPIDSAPIIFDQTNQSSIANYRKILEKSLEAKLTLKDEYLGVVLSVPEPIIDPFSQQIIRKVYVDVPGLDVEGIEHPDIFSDPSADLSFLEYKAFYPVSETLFNTEFPAINDIVRVKVSKNYFSTFNYDPKENVYLGIYVKGQYILPTTDRELSRPADIALQLTKEQRRDSLFQKRPTNALRPEDKLDLPYKGDFEVTELPSPRIRPNYGIPQSHYALDIGMPVGTPIYAVNDQEIIEVGYQQAGAGNYIIGSNGIYRYLYFHLSEQKVKKGTFVTKGTAIGLSGKTGNITGPHLHFEVQDMSRNKLNPLYFLNGTLKIKDSVVQTFGLTSNILQVPFENDANINSIDKVSVDLSEEQSVPKAVNQSRPDNVNASNKSPPRNRPKMLLQDIPVDKANGIRTTANIGSPNIKIREDLLGDIQFIKEKLNQYNIALTCQDQDIKLLNDKISLLAKVGLEVRLNPYSALAQESNLDTDDYFIGPDYKRPVGNGYKLIVYGNVRKNINFFDEKYVPEKKIVEVYDPKQLRSNGSPVIKKIFKSVINITKLFEDRGFVDVLPNQEFFLYSNIEKSNWNIFQKPSKIIVGYSYKELLSTVYYNNGEAIWKLPDLTWDGSKFI